eukprot:Amastigsp_a177855_19.p3 type:complete len:179 gc:universal Amastigsp_a177855_19:511-1047(+)
MRECRCASSRPRTAASGRRYHPAIRACHTSVEHHSGGVEAGKDGACRREHRQSLPAPALPHCKLRHQLQGLDARRVVELPAPPRCCRWRARAARRCAPCDTPRARCSASRCAGVLAPRRRSPRPPKIGHLRSEPTRRGLAAPRARVARPRLDPQACARARVMWSRAAVQQTSSECTRE